MWTGLLPSTLISTHTTEEMGLSWGRGGLSVWAVSKLEAAKGTLLTATVYELSCSTRPPAFLDCLPWKLVI